MTRLSIFFWPINLEIVVYLLFYQIWCDKTNSLRKSEGKGILWKYSGNCCDEEKVQEMSGVSSGKNKIQQENELLKLMNKFNTGDMQTTLQPLTNLPSRYVGNPYKQDVI